MVRSRLNDYVSQSADTSRRMQVYKYLCITDWKYMYISTTFKKTLIWYNSFVTDAVSQSCYWQKSFRWPRKCDLMSLIILLFTNLVFVNPCFVLDVVDLSLVTPPTNMAKDFISVAGFSVPFPFPLPLRIPFRPCMPFFCSMFAVFAVLLLIL